MTRSPVKCPVRMKYKIKTKFVQNLEELVKGITDFWDTRVTPEKCRRYIAHLQKVLPIVVERQGKASGH